MRLARAEIFDPSGSVAVHARRSPNLGRYRSRSAVVACAAYVDLNPIRAALAETLETSDYTSVQRQIASLASDAKEDASSGR